MNHQPTDRRELGTSSEAQTVTTVLGHVALPQGPAYTAEDLRVFMQLGAMSAAVAHKIRNPLAGISAAAEVLQSMLEEGDDGEEFVELILEEVGKAERTINDLLAFARRQEPCLMPLALADEVDRVVAMAQADLNAKGIAVTRDTAADCPLALGDAEQLSAALAALVRNAHEAMDDGGTFCLSVEPAYDDSGARWVQVAIADNGRGIPADHMDQLFNPFFSTKASGFGLGLAVARRLVEIQGGSIGVASWPGEGSVFTVRLPAAPDDSGGSGA